MHTHTHTHSNIHTHTQSHTHIYIYTLTCTHTLTYTHPQTCTHVRTHTLTCTLIHTHTHSQAYTQVLLMASLSCVFPTGPNIKRHQSLSCRLWFSVERKDSLSGSPQPPPHMLLGSSPALGSWAAPAWAHRAVLAVFLVCYRVAVSTFRVVLLETACSFNNHL